MKISSQSPTSDALNPPHLSNDATTMTTPPPSPPKSYKKIAYTQIKLSHHPSDSPSATPVIVITLHRPNNNNAFTPAMMLELEEIFGVLSRDDRVKAIIVTGHGKMFCPGADLEWGFKGDEEGTGEKGHRDGGGRVALAVARCRKPTIAAINGAAVGVGITMTLPMTIRLATRVAKIGFVFASRGLVTEAASSFYLPRLIGYGRATHVVSTGAVYRADDNLFNGLFSEFADSPEAVFEKAVEIAEGMVQNVSAVGAFLSRELIWRGKSSPEEQHLLDSKILAHLRGAGDNVEGVNSFMEKRPAKYTASADTDLPSPYPWWSLVDTKQPALKVGTGKLTAKL